MANDITCPACKEVPANKVLYVRLDGHVQVHGNTGLAIGCSIDGGYSQRQSLRAA